MTLLLKGYQWHIKVTSFSSFSILSVPDQMMSENSFLGSTTFLSSTYMEPPLCQSAGRKFTDYPKCKQKTTSTNELLWKNNIEHYEIQQNQDSHAQGVGQGEQGWQSLNRKFRSWYISNPGGILIPPKVPEITASFRPKCKHFYNMNPKKLNSHDLEAE